MSLITLPIQPQAFEIIRDQIAVILTDEIDNQHVLTYDTRLSNIKVFVEAANPEDKVDLSIVNVSFVKAGFGELKAYDGTTKGTYIYFIDFYTNSKQTATSRGDKLSTTTLQRLLGVSRVILDYPVYKTLGFGPGFIFRVNCKEINIRDESKNDALNSRMGRLMLEVQAQETTGIPEGILLVDSDTRVQLNDTEEGYYYTIR